MVIILLVGGLVFGVLFFLFKKNTPITNFPPQGKSIIAFGDSLIKGVGSTVNNDFVSLLEKMTGEKIINMGVAGDTTGDGLARIDTINAQDPKIVLLLLGGNDFLRRIPAKETFKNLDEIIVRLHAEGTVVILLGIRGGILSDQYKKYFENTAEKHRTFYIPNVLDGLFGKSKFMDDSIHPNDLGYQKISEKILPILQKAL